MSRRVVARCVALLLPALAACAKEAAPGEFADLIVANAKVYTMSWSDADAEGGPAADAPITRAGEWAPDAEAVVIREGRIIFVGSTADALPYRGDNTRVIDARGRVVLPGLIDSHVHIANLGAKLESVDLTGVATDVDAIQRVSQRAINTPKGQWIIGQGWDEGAWANKYPDMALLSQAVPDHPVYLRGLHSFAVWGNKRAFELAGITGATTAPAGGEIVHDSTGAPTGILLNTAVQLLDRVIPRLTLDQVTSRIQQGLTAAAAAGYVEVHEAGADSLEMAALQALAAANKLPIRVYAMLSARDTSLLKRWRTQGPDTSDADMLVVRSVKAFYDGALGSRGARLLEDYSDRVGHRGVSSGFGFDTARVAAMMRAGFQVAIHAIGDAGNRATLDFIQRVTKDSLVARTRPRVEHAQVVSPRDFSRFAALNVIASMQPSHAVEDMIWAEERVGPDRILGGYAWRTMRQHGVPLTFNSDLPGTDYDFYYGLHSAITRRNKDKLPPSGWYPAQRMTPEEAVRGWTSWAAYAGFEEDRAGTIAVGKRGDLTMIDADPFVLGVTAPSQLLTKHVTMTIVGGNVVFPPP